MYLEGNRGGDYLSLSQEPNSNLVTIQVGHCCVSGSLMVIPVEVLTSAMYEILYIQGVKNYIDGLKWPDDYKAELKAQVTFIPGG
jgi:hypothetical protein